MFTAFRYRKTNHISSAVTDCQLGLYMFLIAIISLIFLNLMFSVSAAIVSLIIAGIVVHIKEKTDVDKKLIIFAKCAIFIESILIVIGSASLIINCFF